MASEQRERAHEGQYGARHLNDLPARLRRETADLHTSVEASSGIPHSVMTVDDYTVLLRGLHDFHQVVEQVLADPRWATEWPAHDLDMARHRRVHLLTSDLAALSASAPSRSEPFGAINTFAAALGCLYVAEGSSLGGRVIGPAIRARIGPVPTSFFDGTGRGHPSPWRSVTSALRRYGVEGDGAAVVEGARATFAEFERRVASSRAGRP